MALTERLGASKLATCNRTGIGATHLCLEHGYLAPGKSLVLVMDNSHVWRACFYCLAKEEHYNIEPAGDAKSQPT